MAHALHGRAIRLTYNPPVTGPPAGLTLANPGNAAAVRAATGKVVDLR